MTLIKLIPFACFILSSLCVTGQYGWNVQTNSIGFIGGVPWSQYATENQAVEPYGIYPIFSHLDTSRFYLHTYDTVSIRRLDSTHNDPMADYFVAVLPGGELQRVSIDSILDAFTEVDGSITNELVPSGTMLIFAGPSLPTGYLWCDGSAVSRTTYASLFSSLGTAWGVGDGSTTFNLPDTRGRFPFGKDTSAPGDDLGESFGNKNHVHTIDPPNTSTSAPSANVTNLTLLGLLNDAAADDAHTHSVDIGQFNSGTANPPAFTANFIIKY